MCLGSTNIYQKYKIKTLFAICRIAEISSVPKIITRCNYHVFIEF